jgi:hypothetical protein
MDREFLRLFVFLNFCKRKPKLSWPGNGSQNGSISIVSAIGCLDAVEKGFVIFGEQ